jgi:trigger factor
VEFDGGKAEDAPLVLGSGQFIPGFEEQLVGVKAGDEKVITVSFPEDYPAPNLKGKDATFDITVKQVKIAGETVVDEDFAKALGLESLDMLRQLLRGQLEQESGGLTRTQMKRQLLDKLAGDHDFAVPPTMVEAEFQQIWAQLQQEAAREDDPATALKEIEDDREDYLKIAERRVRLGLLLSEIGQSNGVEVSVQEMRMLVQQAAQQYRQEDRQRFVDYVQSDAMAQAQLRAPLYEDKVVDFLFDKAEISEREVTREELEAAIEADDTSAAPPAEEQPAANEASAKMEVAEPEAALEAAAAGAEQPAPKKAAKKAPARKAAADEVAPADAAEKPVAKKAPAKKPAKKEAAGDA